ncbi:MAG: Bug family tripartite tricarboxylate transporter substrate binding protein [Burkholderiales bacterium]
MQVSPGRQRWRPTSVAVLALTTITGLPLAHAQTFPAKPVRMIVPFAPGGGADLTARGIAQRLSTMWKQPVVPQNIAGAAGNLAAATAAASQADGYTLFFATVPIIVSNPALYDKLPFNPDRDFSPVILIGEGPHVLLVSSGFKATKLSELIALAKERPGQLNFGSGGVGTSLHLAGEYVKARAGIELVHVPYKGAAPAIAAMQGNEIQMLFDNGLSAIGHIRSGRTRGLAIASESRSPVLPEVPTFEESGIPNFRSGVGHSIYVRSGTSAAIVQTANRAINTVLQDAEYKQQMTALAYNLAGGTPEQLKAHIESERKKWLPIIRTQKIKAE